MIWLEACSEFKRAPHPGARSVLAGLIRANVSRPPSGRTPSRFGPTRAPKSGAEAIRLAASWLAAS